MRDNDNTSDNFFIRWKQNVDHHIGATLSGVFGIPSMVSRTYWGAEKVSAGEDSANDGSRSISGPNGRGGPAGGTGALPPDARLVRQWYHWTIISPYSPWNLQYMPQPVPSDLPAGMELSPGGFADAFEDLLRAVGDDASGSAGEGAMADHRERERRGKGDRLVAHRGGFDPRVLWLAGLRAEGLLGAAYGPSSEGRRLLGRGLRDNGDGDENGALVPSTKTTSPRLWRHPRDHSVILGSGNDVRVAWLEGLREKGIYNYYFPHPSALAIGGGWAMANRLGGTLFDDLLYGDWPVRDQPETPPPPLTLWDWKGEAAKAFKEASEASAKASSPSSSSTEVRSLFDELDRIFKQVALFPEDPWNRSSEGWGTTRKPGDNATKDGGKGDGPRTEDELVSAIRSAFSDPERSLSTLLKVVAGHYEEEQEQRKKQEQTKNVSATADDEPTTVTTTDTIDTTPGKTTTTTNRDDAETGGKLQKGQRRTFTETTRNPDGSTTVTEREERIDALGARHVKVVTRTLDQDGNEISVQREHSVRSGWEGRWSWGGAGDDKAEGEEDDGNVKKWTRSRGEDDENDAKKGGAGGSGSWFWK